REGGEEALRFFTEPKSVCIAKKSRVAGKFLRGGTLAFLCARVSVALALGRAASIVPETVVVPSGKLQLKGFLWKPNGPGPFPAVLFNHGSGGVDADHTAGFPITEAAEKLAPLFLKHGYAFLYLFRRGQGLSG